MERRYPALSDNFKIHITPEGGYLEGIKVKEFRGINVGAMEIFLLCNGINSIEDISKILASNLKFTYNEDLFNIINDFIMNAAEYGDINLYSTPQKHNIKTSGSKKYFSPVAVSFETTSRCNEKCLHCYRSCTMNPQEQELELKEVEKLLYILFENGVYNIELTGGELLMNKKIDRIVELSCQYFGSVSLLTNGTLITNKFLDKIEEYKERIMIQIPLESKDNLIHDEFRGLSGSAIRTKKNIKLCTDRGFKVRAAAMITPFNLNSIEETAKYAIEDLNVIGFSLSSIIPIGRGKEYIDSWGFNQEDLEKFVVASNKIVHILQEKYPHHISKVDLEKVEKITTCGICRDSVCIDPSGNIRTCVSCSSDLLYLGNILNDNWEDIYSGSKFLKLQEISWPSEKLDYCKNCLWLGFCSRCHMRAITKNVDLYQKDGYVCPWAIENDLQDFIKEELEFKNNHSYA